MAIAEMTFTQQRTLERNQKKAAEEKKARAIRAAFQSEQFAETKIASRIIKKAHILSAAQWIGENITPSLIRGQHLGATAKASLTALAIAEENDADSYPLAASAAAVTLKAILEVAVSQNDFLREYQGYSVYQSQGASKVIASIGKAVEHDLKITSLAETNKLYFHAVKKVTNNPAYSAEAKALAAEAAFQGVNPFTAISAWFDSQAQQSAFVMPAAEFTPIEWTAWTNTEVAFIANFFLKAVESCDNVDALRFWDVEAVPLGVNDTPNFYVLADSLDIDEEIEKEIINTRSRKPMLMKPINWMDGVFGGYASNQELKTDPFIRGIKSNFAPEAQIGKAVYATINKAQAVGFTINEFLLDAVNELLPQLTKDTAKLGKFIAPIKGVHFTKSGRAKAALLCAEEYKGKVFYHPWNVDYRGRMYPITTVLNVQSTDFEKALLRTAVSYELNDRAQYWMEIHIANCAGQDKLTLDGRVAWAQANIDFIKDVAANPAAFLKSVANGQKVDKPFQLVAICKEYVDCFITKVKSDTNVLVAVDATCSGIQILAGITKDVSAAQLVNVKQVFDANGIGVKGDAYQAVADYAKQILTGEIPSTKKVKLIDGTSMAVSEFGAYADILDRGVCKKVVMTLAYNSSPQSHTEYLRKAVKDKGVTLPENLKNAVISAFGIAIRDAMKDLLPNVIQFKDWINKCAAARAEQSNAPLIWVTPSGFQVVQAKNEWTKVKLHSNLGGKKCQIILLIDELPEVVPNKHGTCSMPNFVHSLDASVLHYAFKDAVNAFALIHDSIMVTAGDVDYAIAAYKASYVHHFGNDNYFNILMDMFYDYQPKNVKPFNTGDLVVTDVLDSQYFLS
jgi:hypothetical protein